MKWNPWWNAVNMEAYKGGNLPQSILVRENERKLHHYNKQINHEWVDAIWSAIEYGETANLEV